MIGSFLLTRARLHVLPKRSCEEPSPRRCIVIPSFFQKGLHHKESGSPRHFLALSSAPPAIRVRSLVMSWTHLPQKNSHGDWRVLAATSTMAYTHKHVIRYDVDGLFVCLCSWCCRCFFPQHEIGRPAFSETPPLVLLLLAEIRHFVYSICLGKRVVIGRFGSP